MEVIKKYLMKTNRPYSLIDISNNLQNQFAKPTFVKALESLVSAGTVLERVNGKQKIYFVSQNLFEFDQTSKTKLEEEKLICKNKLSALKENVKLKHDQIKLLKHNVVPLGDLQNKHDSLKQEISTLEQKLNHIREQFKNVDPSEQAKIRSKKRVLIQEWKSRKRIATEALDRIVENDPKSRKELYEEIGIETDEDYNVIIPK